MNRQLKATQFSLLVHALFFLGAFAVSQHAAPMRLPVALDFCILPSIGPAAGSNQEAAQPVPPTPAPVVKNKPKPVAKKAPPPVAQKKPVTEKTPPAETVPVATSPPPPHPQENSRAATETAATDAGVASPNSAATHAAGAGTANGSLSGNQGGLYAASQLDGPLAVVAKAPPTYPPAAKRRNIEGWIKVKFVVDERGQVDRVSVLDAQPEGVFEQTVLRCVSGWRFKPGTKGGVTVKALVEQTITFKLEG